eukprot:2257877-Rhodomonas_salina.1
MQKIQSSVPIVLKRRANGFDWTVHPHSSNITHPTVLKYATTHTGLLYSTVLAYSMDIPGLGIVRTGDAPYYQGCLRGDRRFLVQKYP